jgi:formylmethanofuran dehydrogenase subunit E
MYELYSPSFYILTSLLYQIYCTSMRFSRPRSLNYQETIRFHGHSGPFLALGYRLGTFLIKKFKPKGIMDFTITVMTKPRKPFTCLIDGLQCSTFATLGKGTMVLKNCDAQDIVVCIKKGKNEYTYQISNKAMETCLNADNLHKAALEILKTPAKNLWTVL